MPGGPDAMRKVFEDYRATMAESRREFLERYRFADFALKVVGVGSVGTRCFVMVLEGRDEDDPLILQAKEATASVLEDHLGASGYANHGERVVVGQRADAGDARHLPGLDARTRGSRLLRPPAVGHEGQRRHQHAPAAEGLGFYGGICAWALARAHARSGDSVAISAYLGTSDTFDGAIADFAETYADQNEQDHRAYVAAIEAGTGLDGEMSATTSMLGWRYARGRLMRRAISRTRPGLIPYRWSHIGCDAHPPGDGSRTRPRRRG